MNFKEPVSTFTYNLISLHHDIIWYIILILSLVYWTLYKIIKEYLWSISSKQDGFFLIFYKNNTLYKMQSVVLFIWFKLFYRIMNIFYYVLIKIYSLFYKNIKKNNTNSLTNKLSFFFLGKGLNGLSLPLFVEKKNYNFFENIIIERFLSYYLFNITSNGLYFYEGYDKFLMTHQFKHSINLEYIFGIFPTIIIGFIILPSMYLLYSNEIEINPGLTIKIIGHQWFWSYESSNISYITNLKKFFFIDYNYESIIINEDDLPEGGKRLLETDTSLVLPYNIAIKFLITSSDVLHAWALPELGIKVDAVPGRLNQAITIPSNLGVYYGQCSELCGVSHGFMPIKVNIIKLEDYLSFIQNNMN
jgi:heme/copper-type cytochrome/quinol oxidase subunit 2